MEAYWLRLLCGEFVAEMQRYIDITFCSFYIHNIHMMTASEMEKREYSNGKGEVICKGIWKTRNKRADRKGIFFFHFIFSPLLFDTLNPMQTPVIPSKVKWVHLTKQLLKKAQLSMPNGGLYAESVGMGIKKRICVIHKWISRQILGERFKLHATLFLTTHFELVKFSPGVGR